MIGFDYSCGVLVYSGQLNGANEREREQFNMKTITRKQAKETIESKGLVSAIGIGKSGLTAKQRKFAEKIVLDGLNASDAYRASYNTKGNPATVNPHASRLRANDKIQATIEALEQAKEAAALHSIESLKALVISTLTDIATNSDKDAVRVQAVKTLGTVVGVDMFRETKRIETVKDSDEIKTQIMQQLKTMMLGTDSAQEVDATELLSELAGDANLATSDPTTPPPCQFDNGTPTLDEHTIPHEQSDDFSEDPPVSVDSSTPQGDIFLEKKE